MHQKWYGSINGVTKDPKEKSQDLVTDKTTTHDLINFIQSDEVPTDIDRDSTETEVDPPFPKNMPNYIVEYSDNEEWQLIVLCSFVFPRPGLHHIYIYSGADPGFDQGGAPDRDRPKTAILGPQFCRILVLGPHFWWSGGGRAPGAPLDPPLIFNK